MLVQLLEVPTEESPAWAQVEAVEILDQQRAVQGAFLLAGGAVLLLGSV